MRNLLFLFLLGCTQGIHFPEDDRGVVYIQGEACTISANLETTREVFDSRLEFCRAKFLELR